MRRRSTVYGTNELTLTLRAYILPYLPMSHYRIAPKNFPPADNLRAKIRRARRVRAGQIFTGKLSAGETFLGGDPIGANGETFYGASDILIRGRHSKSVIIFLRMDFSWGRHFNVTPVSL